MINSRTITYFILSFGFYVSTAFSQSENKSKINLEFTSEFEKQIIENIIRDSLTEAPFLDALLAIDSEYDESDVLQRKLEITDFLKNLGNKAKVTNKKKALKYIFERTHSRFFKKYEIETNFSSIFNSSIYNCVTATALYCHIFDYFKIPYQIKEVPSHVFLVAYPEEYNVYVETTVPGESGSYIPSEKAIRKAVEDLIEMKQITKEYVNNIGYNEAYNEYFYGNGNVTKQDLIGMQYYNNAILNFGNKKYKESYNNALKAELFYNDPKVDLLKESALALVIDDTDFGNISEFKWFLHYAENNDNEDFLNYKLHEILRHYSWGKKEYSEVEKAINTIEKEDAKNVLLESYYVFRALKMAKMEKSKPALEYAKKAHSINPNNLEAKNIISYGVVRKMTFQSRDENMLDEIKKQEKEFPFLTEFGNYNSFKILVLSFLTSEQFRENKEKEAMNSLEQLINLLDTHADEIDYSHEALGNAFGQAGAYFYRQKKSQKALEYLDKGFEYSPDNPEIKRKKKLIKSMM